MGIFEKSGDYVGIFEGKNWWGQVGIFGNRDGDFQPKPCGNTALRRRQKSKDSKINYYSEREPEIRY